MMAFLFSVAHGVINDVLTLERDDETFSTLDLSACTVF